MKSGFVSIFGKPNAGKSTLLNALVGEKMAIVSPKVQTTRHRIRAFLNGPGYQVIFSDTPGIIRPEYKLHEKMMDAVSSSFVDADLALLIADARDKPEEIVSVFDMVRVKVPVIVIINKADLVTEETIHEQKNWFETQPWCKSCLAVSALKQTNIARLVQVIVDILPAGEPFFGEDELTDLPTRFFVAELIREKIFDFLEQEIPYQSTVVVTAFKEQEKLIKISAEIIVHRESQKAIILGEQGQMIKKLGTEARKSIELFLGSKVYLELFVKVRPKWRDNELQLKEYGYQ
jgi:GTP-binding protein Era